jgi:hypothetical protein
MAPWLVLWHIAHRREQDAKEILMAHRASYVLVEHGTITAYYSHWGAKAIPAVVLGGFDETRAYVRALRPADGLLDIVWAEGGILLDADTHTVLFWGGDGLMERPDLRRLFVPYVRLMWPGWTVSWATHGVVDFVEYPGVARALGQDPASLIRDDPAKWDPYPEAEIRTPPEFRGFGTVITVTWEDGQVADYTFGENRAPGYLTAGPDLLAILRGRAPDTLPREDGDVQVGSPAGGAYVDVPTRALWVWEDRTLHPAYLARVERAWPGWHVEGHIDGLAHQLALSGRDPALVAAPRDHVIAQLLTEVAWGDTFDPAEVVRMMMPPTEGKAATFAPGFFRVDRPATSPAQRRELLLRLIQQATGEVARDNPGQ